MWDPYVFPIVFTIFGFLQKEAHGIEESAECANIINTIDSFYRCCTIPTIELPEERKAIAETCHRNIIGDGSVPNTEGQEIYECFEECYFNGSRWLTADLKPNEAVIIADYEEKMKNFPQWKEPIIRTVKTCIGNDYSKPQGKCKSGAYQFSNCLERNIILNCPEDSWLRNDEVCVNTKTTLEKCMINTNKS